MYKYLNTTYGDYTFTKFLGKNTYEAVCNKCGKVRTYKTNSIKPGCGTCSCTRSGINIGDRFGRLVVKYRDHEPHTEEGVVYWMCQCDCGKEVAVKTKSLKNGNTRSCGCLNDEVRRERIVKWNEEHAPEMVGRTSGWLTVIRPATDKETIGRPKGIGYWYCECRCGNHHIVGTSDFNVGKVQSCGCLNSKGEAKIAEILENMNIDFLKQFTFDDLKTQEGKKYAYDFAIMENGKVKLLIEFDGIQHFSSTCQFSLEAESALKTIQARDAIKNKYAYEHGIPLIRIPYTHFDKLSYVDLDIDTSNFVI